MNDLQTVNPFVAMRYVGAKRTMANLAGDVIKAALPAGYRLIAHRPESYHLAIVYAVKDGSNGRLYATWRFNFCSGGCGNGRYFDDREDAEKNYLTR